MNLKTTLALACLVVVGAVSWAIVVVAHHAGKSTSPTLAILENELAPENIQHIEVKAGALDIQLDRDSNKEWTLPGKWLARQDEAKQLLERLGNLRSRFAAIHLSGSDPDLKPYGLDKSQDPVHVTLKTDGTTYSMIFGEEPGADNRFTRATFLRLEDQPEVIRLSPGLAAALRRPLVYYLQHRLFLGERVTGADETDKEQLIASSLEAQSETGQWTLTHKKDDWFLSAPFRDAADPDKLKAILTAIPDIWVEYFVETPDADLEKYGLKKPAESIQVVRGKVTRTLLVGGLSPRIEKREIPAPPPQFGMPQPPKPPRIEIEKYRYAKLKDNDRIFEIKDGRLKGLRVAAAALRDPKLARFNSMDARRLDITWAGKTIVMEKKDFRWHLVKPAEYDAEESKVTELIDKLAGLEARDKDILDKADLKQVGLEPAAGTVAVEVEESKGEGDKKKTKKKSFKFLVGKDDVEKKKLHLRVGDWPRVDLVDDSLLKLVERPALAYRSRRVLDFMSNDLVKLDVKHGAAHFALAKNNNDWKLTAPEPAAADAAKARRLVDDLGRLDAVEYVSDSAKPEDLDKLYGLKQPTLSADVSWNQTKAGKPEIRTEKLLIGKQLGDKPEYYARLDGKPQVFVVKKEIVETLDKGSLALLPQDLWTVPPADINELRVQKEAEEYDLQRDGANWRITAPFEGSALPNLVEPIIKDLATLHCERYEALSAKTLANYGLDKPYLRVVLISGKKPAKKDEPPAKKDDKKDKKDKKAPPTPDKPPEVDTTVKHVLLIGKPTAADAKTRFAKLGTSESVFVVGEKFLAAAERSPYDLLDRLLLSINPKQVTRIQLVDAKTGTTTIERMGDGWNVAAPAAKFAADRDVLASMLAYFSALRADKLVAYGPKANLASFGLDKPEMTITLKVLVKENPYVLALGKPVDKEGSARYVRVDNGPAVGVLPANTVADLMHSYLDLVDHSLLKLDASTVPSVQRVMGESTLEIEKKDGKWAIAKPQPQRADNADMDDLLQQLGSLRAQRVAAYQPKDLKPFGLDAPTAVWTLRPAGADKKPVVVKVGAKAVKPGATAPTAGNERYVQVEGSPVVGVVDGVLAKRLVAPPLQFRDRNVARFTDADRVILQAGARKATFSKVDGTWKLTSPIASPAEHSDLEELINKLSQLRADELVADKNDGTAFGLDRPALQWSFQANGKEVLGLNVGNFEKISDQGKEKDGPRRYAKLTGSDTVFLLNPELTRLTTREYRNRTVWPALDAAQVDAIRFDAEGKSFQLEKVGAFWLLGKKQIKTEKVTELLDALARLKAENYVEDKDANLKLYGLDPAILSLEIATKSGKRTLQIGRQVGESNRRYARIGDPTHTEVFIIAAEDATRIVRDPSWFEK